MRAQENMHGLLSELQIIVIFQLFFDSLRFTSILIFYLLVTMMTQSQPFNDGCSIIRNICAVHIKKEENKHKQVSKIK